MCRKIFLSVFQITRRRLETVSGKMKDNDVTLLDKRRKGQKQKKSDAVRQQVGDNIGSFPRVASHYTRREGQNTKQYLWTEDVAKRGTIEIPSSLWKYSTTKYSVLPDGRKLTLWTERCGGQNNNRRPALPHFPCSEEVCAQVFLYWTQLQ